MKFATRITLLSLLILFASFTARAADVVVTSGSITNVCSPFQNSRTVLSGQGFSLSVQIDGFPPRFLDCTLPTVTVPLDTYRAPWDPIGTVSFMGMGSALMNGTVYFTANSISGTVTAIDGLTLAQLFTVNFTATGIGTQGVNRADFTVTSPIPEPATMILLGTGIAGVGAAVWRRRKASGNDVG